MGRDKVLMVWFSGIKLIKIINHLKTCNVGFESTFDMTAPLGVYQIQNGLI